MPLAACPRLSPPLLRLHWHPAPTPTPAAPALSRGRWLLGLLIVQSTSSFVLDAYQVGWRCGVAGRRVGAHMSAGTGAAGFAVTPVPGRGRAHR